MCRDRRRTVRPQREQVNPQRNVIGKRLQEETIGPKTGKLGLQCQRYKAHANISPVPHKDALNVSAQRKPKIENPGENGEQNQRLSGTEISLEMDWPGPWPIPHGMNIDSGKDSDYSCEGTSNASGEKTDLGTRAERMAQNLQNVPARDKCRRELTDPIPIQVVGHRIDPDEISDLSIEKATCKLRIEKRIPEEIARFDSTQQNRKFNRRSEVRPDDRPSSSRDGGQRGKLES